jgi:hypothetical protein
LTLAVLALLSLGMVAAPLVAFREARLRGEAVVHEREARTAEACATQLADSEAKLRREAEWGRRLPLTCDRSCTAVLTPRPLLC